MLRPNAAIQVSAGFFATWLLLDVRGFRLVLARDWHECCGATRRR
jgi:hypothetical protein